MPDEDPVESPDSLGSPDSHGSHGSFEKGRLAQETKNERQVWYFLAYFLFGIHIMAFVMIYAVRHAK